MLETPKDFPRRTDVRQSTLLHLIVDYAPGDLAVAEVISAVAVHAPDFFTPHVTSVQSFNTLETGFVLGQLGLQRQGLRPEKMVIYANCAPRKDRREARHDNQGEKLVYARLRGGVEVVAVNSGHTLSVVKNEIESLHAVKVDRGGSQFRSRDNFPPFVGAVMSGAELQSLLGEKLEPTKVIPELPNAVVGYKDSFGNLKTTIRSSSTLVKNLTPGQHVTVSINGKSIDVQVATGSFNIAEGGIAFAPGSSGHVDRFWEFFQRGGNVWDTFDRPRVGAPIDLQVIQ